MQFKTTLRMIGVLLMMFSLSMLPPYIIAKCYGDGDSFPFISSFFITLASGIVLWSMFRSYHHELKTRDGFLIVTLFWVVLCLFAALPLMIAPQPHDNLTDAMFESVSGFTTTGATVVAHVEGLSHAMRYYRQQLQFTGGMGIIVLAVAILPMLGVGGMQLYRAETPGPIKDSKLTPRITETAKTLWYIYVGLNILCAVSFHLCGMTWYDAIGESFATISTGGFAMHDTSFAYYHSDLIEVVASIFMLLGGTNFALHFLALQKRNLLGYWRDEEFRAYIYVVTGISVLVAATLVSYQIYHEPLHAFIKSFFNVASVMTTTGFVSAPFGSWPTFTPVIIMIGGLIGGCAASTAGGIKVIRLLLLKKQGDREIQRLIHPRSVIAIKFGDQVLPEHILQSMWAFIAAFIGLFVILLLALMATGLDLLSAFGALSACIANVGAGIGQYSTNFLALTKTAKWLLIFAMLAGRLEIFSMMVLLSPSFWRK
jgi:trk/ktr system potassium uptake protein